jgi:hypothetical protein
MLAALRARTSSSTPSGVMKGGRAAAVRLSDQARHYHFGKLSREFLQSSRFGENLKYVPGVYSYAHSPLAG